MALPGTETMRFRRPTAGPNAAPAPSAPKKDEFGSLAPQGWKRRHQGLLQDQVGRQARGPLVPSLSLAFRLLLLVRTAGAMYSVIADCDEVFNFFEPLHYFAHNSGFQTWELSPQFAVRSWAYVLLHWPLAHLGPMLLGLGKRQQFFALRIALGAISSFAEALFFRAVVDAINERVGRYMLVMMVTSAGMWSASVAFLPSSFTMYTTTLASAYWFHPATSTPTGRRRMYAATAFFALGAIVGWPFAAALGVPFVIEQLFLSGGEVVPPAQRLVWGSKRVADLVKAVALAALIAVPVFLVDSWAYGRTVFPPLNIVLYNLFSSHGPELYGTSPPWFYLANLLLNFNVLLPLALASLPALAVTYRYDFRRLGKTQMRPKEGETSPYMLLALRLAPFYLWLAVLSLQPHKEERFVFPAYTLLCFNAAVSVYLLKGWTETAFIAITKSPYRASKATMFSWLALAAVVVPAALSIARILALHQFYHAPFDVIHHFEYRTIPTILSGLGHAPVPPPPGFVHKAGEKVEQTWDYAPLAALDTPVTLCYAKEWHRFPGSYLVPQGIDIRWVESAFDGMMPRRWEPSSAKGSWPREETRTIRPGRFNGANEPSSEPGTYVPLERCDYLVDLHLPSAAPSAAEPDYARAPGWQKEFCATFLDAHSSKWWARLVWLPGGALENGRVWGEYCLLKRVE
ncbi:mannosyltransferase [Cryptotrichosporon argae]